MFPGRVMLAAVMMSAASQTVITPAKCASEADSVGAPPAQAAGQPDAGVAVRTVDIMEYDVHGNTVLPQTTVEATVYPFLGPGRKESDTEAARAALEAAYNKAGYPTVIVEIPPQRVVYGVVRLEVHETPVGRLRVRGSHYFALSEIKKSAPSMAEGIVPHLPDVQKDMVALNQWPDRRVTPALRAGATPGTVDVDLQVEDKLPLHANLEVNNRRSQDTTPLRLVAGAHYDNLWQRGDSINISSQFAPQRPADARVFSGSYLFRVPNSRLSLLGFGVVSKTDVSTVGNTTVIGNGTIIGLRALLPLTARDGFVQSLTAGMDRKDFSEDLLLGADRNRTPITYYPVSVNYQADWLGEKQQTDASVGLVFGIEGLGSNRDKFDLKRFEARPNFVYLRTELSRLQTLPHDIQLYGHFSGQASGAPLISNEQFSLGGLDTIRGYLESEVLGDYGVALQSEVRSPSLTAMTWPSVIDELRVLGFFDVGTTEIYRSTPGQKRSYLLDSVGVGARLKMLKHFNGSLDVGVPLRDTDVTKSGSVRAQFRAWTEF